MLDADPPARLKSVRIRAARRRRRARAPKRKPRATEKLPPSARDAVASMQSPNPRMIEKPNRSVTVRSSSMRGDRRCRARTFWRWRPLSSPGAGRARLSRSSGAPSARWRCRRSASPGDVVADGLAVWLIDGIDRPAKPGRARDGPLCAALRRRLVVGIRLFHRGALVARLGFSR